MNAAEILRRIRRYQSVPCAPGKARPAAVLVPLRASPGDSNALEVVLTRRSLHLPSHAGQVAFPGGRVEPQDGGVIDTALRETHEELSVPPGAVEVVGRLDDMITVTDYHVSTVVGVIPRDLPLVPNPQEVDRVFSVPMSVLLDESRWSSTDHPVGRRTYVVWHLAHDGEDIWGVTAHILRGLLRVLSIEDT